jgi:hypothetical protein
LVIDMKRLLSGLAAALAAASSQAGVLFFDGFESGDFSMWDGITGTGSDPGSVQNTFVYQGNWAARMSGSTTTGVVNGRYKSIAPAVSSIPVIMDFYMKLGAAHSGNRHYAEIRSYSGDAYNTGSLEQLVAIGAYNGATNVVDAQGNITTSSSTLKWQARVAFASYANNGWFMLNMAANRTTDWTHFRMEILPTMVQFYVDGVAGLAVPINRGNTGSLDSIVFSSRLSSANIDGYFDNFQVTAVPEPGALAVLGVGALALLLRRRR